ncbi:hypothetical protein ACFYY5_29315 [Nocardia elegans]|uniref:Uncharacterized protein n=1 Tax=Nocardia elegans TaxID=300029 RepID=A0ABW6TLD8_9NOCA
MPETLGLVVLLKNGEDYTLASRYIHEDDTAIDEAVERARNVIAANPDMFRPETEIAIGEISIREVGR